VETLPHTKNSPYPESQTWRSQGQHMTGDIFWQPYLTAVLAAVTNAVKRLPSMQKILIIISA